jgi:hypothetical protein
VQFDAISLEAQLSQRQRCLPVRQPWTHHRLETFIGILEVNHLAIDRAKALDMQPGRIGASYPILRPAALKIEMCET